MCSLSGLFEGASILRARSIRENTVSDANAMKITTEMSAKYDYFDYPKSANS